MAAGWKNRIVEEMRRQKLSMRKLSLKAGLGGTLLQYILENAETVADRKANPTRMWRTTGHDHVQRRQRGLARRSQRYLYQQLSAGCRVRASAMRQA
jgi:hypothetical protein